MPFVLNFPLRSGTIYPFYRHTMQQRVHIISLIGIHHRAYITHTDLHLVKISIWCELQNKYERFFFYPNERKPLAK